MNKRKFIFGIPALLGAIKLHLRIPSRVDILEARIQQMLTPAQIRQLLDKLRQMR